MRSCFIILQKKLFIAALLYISLFTHAFAQQSLAEAKAPILTVRDLYFKTSDHAIDALTDVNGYLEFWSVGQPDAYTQSFRISWYHEEQLYTEVYLLKGGRLVYALEEVKRMPPNHYTQSVWRCEYFIKDDRVIDYTSLGHGKTEDDAWEPESIMIQFGKRKAELEKIRK
ncbi:hypothetical protein [Parapedobacter sp.]